MAKTVSPSGRFGARCISHRPGDPQTPTAIVAPTTDEFLIQVDVETGKLAHRFDGDWVVDLRKGIAEKFGGGYPMAASEGEFNRGEQSAIVERGVGPVQELLSGYAR